MDKFPARSPLKLVEIPQREVYNWQKESRVIIKTFDDLLSYKEKLGLTPSELSLAEEGIHRKGIKIPKRYFVELLDSIATEKERSQIKTLIIPFVEKKIADQIQDRVTFLDEMSLDNNPKKGLTRMYPDRVLFSPVHTCSMHCDWCFRDMSSGTLTDCEMEDVIDYIRKDPRIKDVIITGGEPLLLSNTQLDFILERMRTIDHVDIIRFHTRIIVTVPSRIEEDFIGMLDGHKRKGKPIYFVTQFIHPNEISERATDAVYRLVSNGFYVLNQAPVLRGVNDDQETFDEWQNRMIRYQIRPYYAISTIIKDGLNSRFFVPFDEVVKLVNTYSSQHDGLGRPTVIAPVMGRKLGPHQLSLEMNERGAYVRNTKSEIWKGTK
jgi:lysine 2,3-aminomutase